MTLPRGLLLDILGFGDEEEVVAILRHAGKRSTPVTECGAGVYYALLLSGLRLKVGHSSNAERRVDGMRDEDGRPAQLLAVEPGSWRLARRRAHEFRAFALGRGIFLYRGPLVDHVERLRGTRGGDA